MTRSSNDDSFDPLVTMVTKDRLIRMTFPMTINREIDQFYFFSYHSLDLSIIDLFIALGSTFQSVIYLTRTMRYISVHYSQWCEIRTYDLGTGSSLYDRYHILSVQLSEPIFATGGRIWWLFVIMVVTILCFVNYAQKFAGQLVVAIGTVKMYYSNLPLVWPLGWRTPSGWDT